MANRDLSGMLPTTEGENNVLASNAPNDKNVEDNN